MVRGPPSLDDPRCPRLSTTRGTHSTEKDAEGRELRSFPGSRGCHIEGWELSPELRSPTRTPVPGTEPALHVLRPPRDSSSHLSAPTVGEAWPCPGLNASRNKGGPARQGAGLCLVYLRVLSRVSPGPGPQGAQPVFVELKTQPIGPTVCDVLEHSMVLSAVSTEDLPLNRRGPWAHLPGRLLPPWSRGKPSESLPHLNTQQVQGRDRG